MKYSANTAITQFSIQEIVDVLSPKLEMAYSPQIIYLIIWVYLNILRRAIADKNIYVNLYGTCALQG